MLRGWGCMGATGVVGPMLRGRGSRRQGPTGQCRVAPEEGAHWRVVQMLAQMQMLARMQMLVLLTGELLFLWGDRAGRWVRVPQE